jgi:hypothetical protein
MQHAQRPAMTAPELLRPLEIAIQGCELNLIYLVGCCLLTTLRLETRNNKR